MCIACSNRAGLGPDLMRVPDFVRVAVAGVVGNASRET